MINQLQNIVNKNYRNSLLKNISIKNVTNTRLIFNIPYSRYNFNFTIVINKDYIKIIRENVYN